MVTLTPTPTQSGDAASRPSARQTRPVPVPLALTIPVIGATDDAAPGGSLVPALGCSLLNAAGPSDAGISWADLPAHLLPPIG
jgi:hypothetical protein